MVSGELEWMYVFGEEGYGSQGFLSGFQEVMIFILYVIAWRNEAKCDKHKKIMIILSHNVSPIFNCDVN